jgi:hypothetical protein
MRFFRSREQPAESPDASAEPSATHAERPTPEPEPPTEPEVTAGTEPGPGHEPETHDSPQPVPAEPPLEQPRVASFTTRSLGVPQRWNLWELERVAREQSGADAIRDEERSFLLMYLREFAEADGVLPTSFDGVVREAFGDALDAVRA